MASMVQILVALEKPDTKLGITELGRLFKETTNCLGTPLHRLKTKGYIEHDLVAQKYSITDEGRLFLTQERNTFIKEDVGQRVDEVQDSYTSEQILYAIDYVLRIRESLLKQVIELKAENDKLRGDNAYLQYILLQKHIFKVPKIIHPTG